MVVGTMKLPSLITGETGEKQSWRDGLFLYIFAGRNELQA
jgi:hypothetical protein